MTSEYGLCDLAVVSLRDTEQKPDSGMRVSTEDHLDKTEYQQSAAQDPRLNGSTLQYSNGTVKTDPSTDLSAACELKQCCVHNIDLDRYCNTDRKLTCSLCATNGDCQSHNVTNLAEKATVVRNNLVDVCEKMQLQSLQIERFIKNTLTARERAVQAEASSARERVLAQVNAVREALEEEEQRLLEAVQREEERVEQCLLTQRAHWSQALDTLTSARTSLVHKLTHSTDAMLVGPNQEIADRIEEAEGVGKPKDTEQLNLNRDCSDSKLLLGLWASALLLEPSSDTSSVARSATSIVFNERSISPLLSLSSDRRTVTFLSKRQRQAVPPQYDPERFDSWPNAICSYPISSGRHRWLLDVGTSAAFKVGVCYASMERKGSGNDARLGYNAKSWALSHFDGDFSFCYDGRSVAIAVTRKPRRVGVLLDWDTHTLLFYDPDSVSVLHTVKQAFSEPLVPACAVADQSLSIVH